MRRPLAAVGKNHASGLFQRTRNDHEGCLSDAWDGSEESVVGSGGLLYEMLGYFGEKTGWAVWQ